MQQKIKQNIKFYLFLLGLLVIVVGVILLLHAIVIPKDKEPPDNTIEIDDTLYNENFSTLFSKTMLQQHSLIIGTIDRITTEQQLIEFYQTDLTTYTRLEVTVSQNLTQRFSNTNITVYLLGDSVSFPNREQFVEGQQYVLRLLPWVIGEEIVYLLTPTESTYYLVRDNHLLYHTSPQSSTYKKIMSVEKFSIAFADFCVKQNQSVTPQSYLSQFEKMMTALKNYDYKNQQLSFLPTEQQRRQTESKVAFLKNRIESIVLEYKKGVLTQQQALDSLRDCMS